VTSNPRENAGRDRSGRFRPGCSGNPAGKPKGARNRATRLAEELLDGEAEAITRRAIAAALDGEPTALRLCLERIAPVRKGRSVTFEIGPLETTGDLARASRRLLEAVADGELTPEEAQVVAGVVEMARRAVETVELEQRIAALEEAGRGR
jgi:hypothetical protein